MPLIRLPSIHDISYEPARGPVLLLTCMDLRVLDEIVQFMDHDNLVNRYDHVVLAGAAYGALGAPGGKDEHGNPINVAHWKDTFFEHLDAAVTLHSVTDVYILQHRNCGAFHKVFHVTKNFSSSPKDQAAEKRAHLKYARALESEIRIWAQGKRISLTTHRFLMDLRGRVEQL